jgi:glycosyltransferase involved in cell wall biosynthesis
VTGHRPAICYVVPGRDLVPGAGATRQALSLARALSVHADVTLVFRRQLGQVTAEPFDVVALEPGGPGPASDAAASHRALGRFVEESCSRFGVVLEGGWSQSGKLAALCLERGIAAVPIVDHLASRGWLAPLGAGRAWLAASGGYLRRAAVVIAASEELKAAIVARWRVEPSRIVVIRRGVDRSRLFPQDQAPARQRLGLRPEHRVLLAGGILDQVRDLTPVIEAVQRVGDPLLRLHVLGGGGQRAELERLAGPGAAVTFHGRVAEDLLPAYLAAADLCVAVERPHAPLDDPPGDEAFTLGESLAAGRPVAVATDRVPHPLVRHLVSGFLIEPNLLDWARFLQRDCPSRNTLRIMGQAAAATPLSGVEQQAEAYLAAAERALHAAVAVPAG